jgi:hypothetical protein
MSVVFRNLRIKNRLFSIGVNGINQWSLIAAEETNRDADEQVIARCFVTDRRRSTADSTVIRRLETE